MFDAYSETEIRNHIAQADNLEDIMAIVIEATSKRHGKATARRLKTPTEPNARVETLRKFSEQYSKIAEYAAPRMRKIVTSPRKRLTYHDLGPATAGKRSLRKQRGE